MTIFTRVVNRFQDKCGAKVLDRATLAKKIAEIIEAVTDKVPSAVDVTDTEIKKDESGNISEVVTGYQSQLHHQDMAPAVYKKKVTEEVATYKKQVESALKPFMKQISAITVVHEAKAYISVFITLK